MNQNRVAAAAVLAFTLFGFFQFPGHTWLQQDTQIWVAVMEHQRNPGALRNDPVAQQPHTAYSLYDEVTLVLSAATGLGWQQVLTFQQIVTRVLGTWGLYLMAAAAGLAIAPALLVTGIVSLGATIVGPAVLTFEYEPTPRAFAIPLIFCAIGLAAHRRFIGAGIAAACAFLYHPPSAIPFWIVFAGLRKPRGLLPLGGALGILVLDGWLQGEGDGRSLFGHITGLDEQLLHLRLSYVWISAWPRAVVEHWILLFVILLILWLRMRGRLSRELRVFSLGLPLLAMAAMPISWLLLENWKWSMVPQVQPLRALLFVALMTQLLASIAGIHAALDRRFAESVACFAAAYVLPLQPVITDSYTVRQVAVLLGLAATAAAAVHWKTAPVAAIAAFLAMPILGGVKNYPSLHTPELAQLSQWARANTARDAVFLFPDAGRALEPGIFRAEALRALYADWKGGGQIAYLRDFGPDWWFRWQQTVGAGYHTTDFARYQALGIGYVVLAHPDSAAGPAVFQNGSFVVYRIARSNR